ncbi:hypothetical protein PVAP13_4NG046065 [Panicum virgatum]|uniref:Uncharacterized protein n=1 Tax=Panicum virgatum TaxID=38727 RepID=A0A8T0TEV3_PANVG|nr:hypothetical protein PVAP13_4NG046065 [Panicum virgatum]
MLRAVTGKRAHRADMRRFQEIVKESFTAGGRWRAAACGRGSKQRRGRRRKRRHGWGSGVGFGLPSAGGGGQQGSEQVPGGSRRWRRRDEVERRRWPEIEKNRREC